MEFGVLNKMSLRGGLSILAVLMLSSGAFAQQIAVDDGAVGPITHHALNDDSTTDPAATDDQATDPVDDGQGIAVGEPDPNGDGTVDDATDTDTATGDDGVVLIYTMDAGGPCIDCNVVTPGRPVNPSEVERTVTAGKTVARLANNNRPAAVANTNMAQCLAAHARSTWICEWQNGAGQ